MKNIFNSIIIVMISFSLISCTTINKHLNPLYSEPSELAKNGVENDNALNDAGGKIGSARSALETMATYRSAHAPQPVNPVIQPSVVRLMWIPDHLNSHGDLVPAHYYYLKVLDDRWAVQDAFELESQLKGKGRSSRGASSSIPFVVDGTR